MKHYSLFIICIVTFLISCGHPEAKRNTESKTVTIDSANKQLQQQYYDALARLDSAVGSYRNTLEDSLYIISIKDTLLKMENRLDSLSVEH